ncbi:MAG: hypothetical protein ACE5OZ_03850 [Candidatus Heimdallarchaeota archaeon]
MEPLSIATIMIISLAVISFIGVGVRLIGPYRKTRRLQTLALAIGFFAGSIGMLFLAGEHGIMTLGHDEEEEKAGVDDPEVSAQAYFVACVAVFFSVITIYCFDLFALSFLSENRKRVFLFSLPLLALLLSYFAFYVWSGLDSGEWHFNQDADAWDIDRSGSHEGMLFALFIIPLFLSPLVMLYGTFQIRGRGPLTTRMFLLSLGQLLASIVYTLEILEPEPTIMVIARIGWVVYPLWMFVWFSLPEFAKRWIKWEG